MTLFTYSQFFIDWTCFLCVLWVIESSEGGNLMKLGINHHQQKNQISIVLNFNIIIILLIMKAMFFLDFCSKEKGIVNKVIVLEKDFEIGFLEGDENYIFGIITDVEVDLSGNIFVLDSKLCQVLKYNKYGKFILKFGKKGQGPGEFRYPESIVLDLERSIYVLDNPKVKIFNKEGRFIHSFDFDFYGVDIAINNKGNLIILGAKDNKIFHTYDRQGKYLYSFGSSLNVPNDFAKFREADMFRTPIRLWSIKNRIYFMNPYKYEIYIYENSNLKGVLTKKSSDYLKPKFKEEVPGGYVGYIADNFIFNKGNNIFVSYNGNKANWLDIYENGELLKSLEVKGILRAIDFEGKFYFIEEEDYPKIVTYILK